MKLLNTINETCKNHMCGIWGSTISWSKEIIEKKINSISFRGPDNKSVKFIDNIFLGSTRLAIVERDLESNMPFEKDGYVIVFNGEIYNYKELREKHLANQLFVSDSDTEVLLELYKKKGADCLNLLNGMFAFTIYDPQKRLLFGARDRTGKKPFYFYNENENFEFASQPNAIKIGLKDVEISNSAKLQYFAWGHVPEPKSIYENIFKLPPGKYFTFCLESRKIAINTYWENSITKNIRSQQISYNDAKEELKSKLIESIKLRMPHNQKFGFSLSGGVDSSLLVALASTFKNDLYTYSVGFENNVNDESKYAMEVSNILGTKHDNFFCKPQDVLRIIQQIPEYYDEPFADSSAIVTSFLFEKTSQYNRVMLTGDGSDELFFGYLRHSSTLDYKNKKKLYISRVIDAFRFKLNKLNYSNTEEFYLSRLLMSESFFLKNQNCIDIAKKTVQITDDLYSNITLSEKILNFDFRNYLVNDIHTKVDRAAMFNQTEARNPFLDYQVVELAQSLPFNYLFDGLQQKLILKDLLRGFLPEELITRKKKGFSVPLVSLFRLELKEYLLDIVTQEAIAKIEVLNTNRIIELRDKHISGKENHTGLLYLIMTYINWFSRYN